MFIYSTTIFNLADNSKQYIYFWLKQYSHLINLSELNLLLKSDIALEYDKLYTLSIYIAYIVPHQKHIIQYIGFLLVIVYSIRF